MYVTICSLIHFLGGIPATALREITLLKGLRHENVVQLKDIVNEANRLYIVFELASSDLKKLMDEYSTPLAPDLVRSYTTQMLKGLAYCHSRGIMHRDIKPQNLLVTKDGYLKLADFGLARTFTPILRPLTMEVITRWYRAPEIMLGCSTYTTAVDIWSTACVIAEMSNKEPFLPGDSEIDQIHKTFKLMGTPNEEVMPGVTALPYWRNNFPEWPSLDISIKLPNLDEEGVDLVEQLLTYNPRNRLTAANALKHPYLNVRSSSPSYILRTPKNSNAPATRHISVDHASKKAILDVNSREDVNSKIHDPSDSIERNAPNEWIDKLVDSKSKQKSNNLAVTCDQHLPVLLEKVTSFGVLTDHIDSSKQREGDTSCGSNVLQSSLCQSSVKLSSTSRSKAPLHSRVTRSSRAATPDPIMDVNPNLPPSAQLVAEADKTSKTNKGRRLMSSDTETVGIAIDRPRKKSKK